MVIMTKHHQVNTQGVDDFLKEFSVRYETIIFVSYRAESVTVCTVQQDFTFQIEKKTTITDQTTFPKRQLAQ